MTKRSKKLVWEITFLLFIAFIVNACASADQLPSETVSKTENCGLELAIMAPDRADFRPGRRLELSANKISADLKYTWSTDPAQFTENFSVQQTQQLNEVMFTVPNFDGILTIKLHVEVSGHCEETAVLEIEMESSATQLAEKNTAVETEATNTPTRTATPTSTPTLAATPTVELSPTPELTASSTTTPQPTLSLQSTTEPITSPVITRLEVLPGGAILVEWYWDGELSPTQNFAVRFWSANDPRPEARYSITWTKELSYEFGINNVDYPIGTYYVNVAVMEGSSQGVHYALAESNNKQIAVEAPPPTAPPPSLP